MAIKPYRKFKKVALDSLPKVWNTYIHRRHLSKSAIFMEEEVMRMNDCCLIRSAAASLLRLF